MAATQILLADALTQAANNPWPRLLGNSCYWPHRITTLFNDRNKVMESVRQKRNFFFDSELVFPLEKNWKIKPVKVEVS